MKKLNLFNRYIYLLAISFLISSCEDFLSIKQNFSQSDGSSLHDIRAILDDATYMNMRTPAMAEGSSDNIFLLLADYNRLDQRSKYLYTWELRDYTHANDWGNLYFQVFSSNLCLENLGDIKPSIAQEREWFELNGSALFYRAHANYWIATTFCNAYDPTKASTDLGIAIRTASDFTIESYRSNLEDSYQHIENDLLKSLEFLPQRVEIQSRPSKAAAFGLLARLYLVKGDYVNAYKYADLALLINNELLDYNDPVYKLSANLPFGNQYNKEVVFYSAIGINTVSTAHPQYARVDTVLYDSYHNDDLRKQGYFLKVGNYYRFKGMYIGDANLTFTGITNAELILIAAECNVRLNNMDKGLQYLDQLLVKRYKLGTYQNRTILSKEESLSLILMERRKELVMRGIRFSDIKRLNREGEEISIKRVLDGKTYVLEPNDPRYALQIPEDVVRLGKVKQNPY